MCTKNKVDIKPSTMILSASWQRALRDDTPFEWYYVIKNLRGLPMSHNSVWLHSIASIRLKMAFDAAKVEMSHG